jgi:DNA polymerase III gamma/tau subunit
MTISTTIVKNSYSGDGSTTTFSYTFKVLAEGDLTVIIRSALGTETIKTLNTHYTITGVGNPAGGSIVFTAGNIPSATETVVLLRDTAQTQAIDYIANDPFPAESHEEGLDRSVILAQELQEEVNRSIKLSRTNTMTNTEFTVGPTDRANKVLAFDSSGELSVAQELGVFKGNWSSAEAFAVRDIVKDTSNNNIYICLTAHTSSGSQPLSSNVDIGKWSLIVDAASATTSATNAAASATAAATSASNAATSATNAATSETNAATSATNAATSETNAASSASAASTSASNASTSATNAATSETNAAASATAAASSASSAATQASNAATSATNAATSETNAASSATAAASSASAASTSASNASTSETNAASSATAAASSATSAASSAASAAASYDSFDDRYLGPKASDPTLDNDGDALLDGALYFNTVSNVLKYWNGTTWGVVESTDTSNLATNGFAIAMAIAL